MTDTEFYRQALELLAGAVLATRSGGGHYTRDRGKWQHDFTLDEVLASIQVNRRS